MKINVLSVAAALLAGMVLGAWGPSMDLRKARDDIKALQSKSAGKTKQATEIQTVRAMLRLPDEQPQRRADHAEARARAGTAAPDTDSTAAAPGRPLPTPAFEFPTNRPSRNVMTGAQIRQASALWKTRVDLARTSFVSKTDLNEEQETTFDVLIEAMNLRLEDRSAKWSDYLKSRNGINPEDGIRMINDLSGVLVLTYDEFDRRLPPDWREKAGENFQLFNFIDPEVAMPLAGIGGNDAAAPTGGGAGGIKLQAGAGSAK